MKKVLFGLALLASVNFVACSKSEEKIIEEEIIEDEFFGYYKGNYDFANELEGSYSVNLLINTDSSVVFYYLNELDNNFDTSASSSKYLGSIRKVDSFYYTTTDNLNHILKFLPQEKSIVGNYYWSYSNIPSFESLNSRIILKKQTEK